MAIWYPSLTNNRFRTHFDVSVLKYHPIEDPISYYNCKFIYLIPAVLTCRKSMFSKKNWTYRARWHPSLTNNRVWTHLDVSFFKYHPQKTRLHLTITYSLRLLQLSWLSKHPECRGLDDIPLQRMSELKPICLFSNIILRR